MAYHHGNLREALLECAAEVIAERRQGHIAPPLPLSVG